MTAALAVYVSCSILVVSVVALFIPRLGKRSMHSSPVPVRRSGGGIVNRIAGWIVLSLGRLTFGTLHLFERLGVDMTNPVNIDEVLASWTSWSEDVKTKLAAALADAQTLRDTDAAEDAAQANALSEALAQKVEDAFKAATSTPEAPVDPAPPVEDPAGPPVTPPSSDVPVTDTPVVDPVVDAPVVEDPAPVDESGTVQ